MVYEFKTKPFRHQKEIFEKTREVSSYAVLWEQGCGKTKPMLDTVAYLYEQGKVDTLLVVAPNGVHRNWISDEIPTHLPDRINYRAFYYQSPKAKTKWHQRACKEILQYTEGLRIIAISYDGFMTEAGKKYMWEVLRRNRCFYVLDEGHYIKSPSAKRTKSIVASGKYAPYKRLLTGTPIAQGPFDLYSQVKFLHPDFWVDRRLGSFAAFKRHFGIWRTRQEVLDEWGYDPGYDQLLDYKNIPQLEGYLKDIGHRLTKDDAGLDLPPKLYSKRYFEMSREQVRVYEEIKENLMAELECGTIVEAPLAIVSLLRLQQITCGYVAAEAEQPVTPIGDKNPRLELAKEICDNLNHKAIIWSRFKADVDALMDALGDKAVRYDGQVDDEARAKAKEDFQKGDAQFFIGNPAAGSTGLTLHAARTVIYYYNSFKLVDRIQSEDREHRIGQEHPVNYIDLIA